MLRSLILAALLIPSNVLACDAYERFAEKWGVNDKTAIVYRTVDATNHMPVAVFDLGKKADPSKRYAVTWLDQPTCTIDAEFGNISDMLLTMEISVYDR